MQDRTIFEKLARCLLLTAGISLFCGLQFGQDLNAVSRPAKSVRTNQTNSSQRNPSTRRNDINQRVSQKTLSPAPGGSKISPRLVVQTGVAPDDMALGSDSAAFSLDGQYVVTGHFSGGVAILWDARSGTELRRFVAGQTEGQDGYMAVGISPDARLVAANGGDSLFIFDIRTGKTIRRLKVTYAFAENLEFSPNGGSVTYGSSVWDIRGGFVIGHTKARQSRRESVETIDGRFRVEQERVNNPGAEQEFSSFVVRDARTGRELGRLKESEYVRPLAISRDGNLVVTSGDIDAPMRVWDVRNSKPLTELRGFADNGQTVFTAAGPATVLSTATEVRFLDWISSRATSFSVPGDQPINFTRLSPDGQLAAVFTNKQVVILDIATAREISHIAGDFASDVGNVEDVRFSPDSRFLTAITQDRRMSLYNLMNGKEVRTFDCASFGFCSLTFSPDGKLAVQAAETDGESFEIFSILDGHTVRRMKIPKNDYADFPNSACFSFSPDGRMLVSAATDGDAVTTSTVRVWDVETGRSLRELRGHTLAVDAVAWSPNQQLIATASADGTARLWDAATGRESRRLSGHGEPVTEVQFSADSRYVITESQDQIVRLCDAQTGRLMARMVTLTGGNWAVIDGQSRFDTNNLESMKGLHWIIPDDPLHAFPIEIFMRDYYEPRLLARILAGEELSPVRPLTGVNRVQPPVKISKVSGPDGDGYVSVTLEAGNGTGKYLVNGKEITRTTGVYDVRLFRDGQIVGSWPADSAQKLQQEALKHLESDRLSGEPGFWRELQDWRQATEVKPNKELKVDSITGTMTLPPIRVKLPQAKDASQIEFTAYAFNEDRVKGQTAKWEWPSDVAARLPKALPVKPRAYIIAVGVNAYENSDFDLGFAADDARRMSQVVSQELKTSGQYSEVIPVTLVSDYETKDCQKMVTTKQATKENFRAVLETLSGNDNDRALLSGVENAGQLQRATPDDLVLIMFSSHGYADASGNFYFIPYDTGPGTGKVFTESVRQHSISSEELSLWLREVDAGEIVMIVDACHSAAAITGQDFKPGPMGSRGLGQLSYDKGMRILTATQADNVAWEYSSLKQGVLSYALLRDGIAARQADRNKDKKITMAEWLEYGVERVPKLYQEVLTNSVQSFGLQAPMQPNLVIADSQCGTAAVRKELIEVLIGQPKSRATQQPSLFDFTRKQPEVVIAR